MAGGATLGTTTDRRLLGGTTGGTTTRTRPAGLGIPLAGLQPTGVPEPAVLG